MEWDEVRELALALADAEETTSWGHPSFKVRGKWFAGMSPHREAEGALVIRCDPDERPLMLAGEPELFYVTPHYENYPRVVLVRLEAATAENLRDRIEDSWLIARDLRR
ncbi:MAG TPA: MmcQ/YjbR family DNA-binding protein [Gaiellaceae bacterium]